MALQYYLRRLLLQRLSWPVHLAFVYAGVVLPLICHLMTVGGPPDSPTWQSGSLDDQLAFTLSARAGFAFYPLMLYSMVSLTLLLIHERRFAERPIIRFGIYTGVPVAAWYCLVLGIVFTDQTRLWSTDWYRVVLLDLFALVPPLVAWGLVRFGLWLRSKLRISWIVVVLLSLGCYAASVLCLVLASGEVMASLFWPGSFLAAFAFFSLLLAPHWCLAVYLVMALRLIWLYPRPPRFGLVQLLAVISWIAAFLGACRWAVVRSLDEYAQLPLQDPGSCYVASAAARGHRSLVGSTCLRMTDRAELRVNRQLQVLKAGELAMVVLTPGIHRTVRGMYDVLGPLLARRLTNPYLADLAYFSLKPAESVTYVALRWILRDECWRIDRLYAER